jgi:Ankyrin repeats (3 copies)
MSASPLRPAAEDAALAFWSLIYAAQAGDKRVVQAWIDRGVDVNGKGLDRKEAGKLGEAAQVTMAPIVVAAAKGHLEIVQALLNAGAKPDLCCCSCITALHEAIRNKHPKVVKLLLDRGANPHLLYDTTTPPLELARKTGSAEIVGYVQAALDRPR